MRRTLIQLFLVFAISWGGAAWVAAEERWPKLGLDLAGGTDVLLRAPDGTDPALVDSAVEIMRRRIEAIGGVQEPTIQVVGGNSVSVQLPGVTDRERALEAVGKTGRLSFRPVLDVVFIPPEGSEPTTTIAATTTTAAGTSTTTGVTTTSLPAVSTTAGPTTIAPSTTIPPTTTVPGTTTTAPATTTAPTTTTPIPTTVPPEPTDPDLDDPTQEAILTGSVLAEGFYYRLGPAEVEGRDISEAEPAVNPSNLTWDVSLIFKSDAADRFQELTKRLATYPTDSLQRTLAIVLDGEIVSAPGIAADVSPVEGIAGGRASITTRGTKDQASALASLLRYGALPVLFEQDQVTSVSASLGSDALRAGIFAGIGGLALVAVALILYYRVLGLVAVLGLSVFSTILLSIYSWLGNSEGLSLTLAGVAGLIVAIGITSDSYVVYFERIKEEARRGRGLRGSVEEGFRRAFRTILTADAVSLLAAGLLWALAVGPVRGFALALGIATMVDIVVAYLYTRPATALLARTRLGEGGRFSIRGAAGVSAPGKARIA